MIDMTVNTKRFMPDISAIERRITEKIGKSARAICYFIDDSVHAKTPVHTGEAIRNMIWSVDTPAPAAFSPIDNGAPGRTSEMGLGDEPRRGPNAAKARASLRTLTFKDPFHVYILHNAASDIGLIEYGSAGVPGKERAPNGVFSVTMAEVSARLNSGVL